MLELLLVSIISYDPASSSMPPSSIGPSKPDRSEIDLIKPVEMKRASVNQASLPAIYDQHDEKAYRNYYQVDGDKKLPTEDAFARSDEIA
ncbi:hypothetical protein FXO38_29459 [Capsicum annuum]|nr:hypothetical protein FXO37_33309 [Capsicum annuum]KAF3626073.1 hypothetical protein FXO38_29459 [Capsicum annuum]